MESGQTALGIGQSGEQAGEQATPGLVTVDPGAALERDESGFVYVADNKRPQYPDEVLIQALRRFSQELGGRAFTRREFDAWAGKPCAAGTIGNRMGGWWGALRRAGVGGVRGECYGAEALMVNLRAIWRRKGRRPGVHDMRKLGRISVTPYMRRWGSVQKACERLARFERGEISKEELLASPPEGQKGRRAIRPGVRWAVLERDGNRCRGCGRGSGEVKLEVDHIVPVWRGGTDDERNLRALCEKCNRGRGRGKRVRGGRGGRWGRGVKRKKGGKRGRRREAPRH